MTTQHPSPRPGLWMIAPPRPLRRLLVLVVGLLAAVFHCYLPLVDAMETGTPAMEPPVALNPETRQPPSPEPSPEADQAVPCQNVQCFKQRYPQDLTGARARLGMCRRDGQDHGGRHRRFHGGPWRNQP